MTTYCFGDLIHMNHSIANDLERGYEADAVTKLRQWRMEVEASR